MECDLGQAQGRAKFSSQARPLWRLLPDGAFKRLVLGEIAQKIQIDARELSELGPRPKPRKNAFSAAAPAVPATARLRQQQPVPARQTGSVNLRPRAATRPTTPSAAPIRVGAMANSSAQSSAP